MGNSLRLDLAEALRRLQAFSGREVRVTTNRHERFFGSALRGHLDRVETLPPDHTAISLVLGDDQGLFIDAGEAEILGGEEGGGWLEFRVGLDLCVLIEPHHKAPSPSRRHRTGSEADLSKGRHRGRGRLS
jgi:hypothetical protein